MNRAMVHIQGDRAVTSSVEVATFFDKEHRNVTRAIRNTLEHVSDRFRVLNFEQVADLFMHGQKVSGWMLTKDGFAMIVLGFTGKEAIQFREAYIERFNEMEALLRRRQYKQHQLNDAQMHDVVRAALGQARPEMSLTTAINAMILRGLHIPPITREAMVKLVKTGVIEGFKRDRQWHVYQDSFADWLEQRKLSS
jgi:Rha family phage regulatory protein